MDYKDRYKLAKEAYASLGINTDEAIEKMKVIPVSLHCWQGDDVTGFDHDGPLTGGIQTTGNYPGKARTPEELMQDMDQALRLMPGKKKLNLHASYAIFEHKTNSSLNSQHSMAFLAQSSKVLPQSSPKTWSGLS